MAAPHTARICVILLYLFQGAVQRTRGVSRHQTPDRPARDPEAVEKGVQHGLF